MIINEKHDIFENILYKIKVEVYKATNGKEALKPECCIFTKEEIMEPLDIDFIEATNYLISLFEATDRRYSCTRTKIGKLLSIVAFVYARQNKRLFLEEVLEYENCGTTFGELLRLVGRDIYREYEYSDNEENICDPIEEDGRFKDIPQDVRKTIEEVFRKFGAYKAPGLGKLIMPIIKKSNVINEDKTININQIYLLEYNDFDKEEKDNVLIQYLFKPKKKE